MTLLLATRLPHGGFLLVPVLLPLLLMLLLLLLFVVGCCVLAAVVPSPMWMRVGLWCVAVFR